MLDTTKMFAESARLIQDASRRPPPVAKGMARWFEYCQRVAPERQLLWDELAQLDFDGDAARLEEWIAIVLSVSPPPDEINGLWFGLFNPADDGCQLYLGGSTGFDPTSESNEWACDLPYQPMDYVANSQILPEIYQSVDAIRKGNITMLGEPFLCHGYIALVISNWCHGSMREQLLGSAEYRAVAMGHNSGDFYRLAVLKA